MNAGIATVGLARDAKHRYFLNGAGPVKSKEYPQGYYPSVTWALQAIDRSGPLIGWAKNITAQAALEHRAELDGWVKTFGLEAAQKMLTQAATVQRDRAANAGSEIHQLAEAIVRGHDVEVPEDLAPYVAAYRTWISRFEPEFLAAEEMVVSERHGYAGTLDAIVRIAGEIWLLDLKTSRGVYLETACQLSAYGAADFIGKPGDPRRYAIPKIDQYGVVHIRPEGAELVPYDVTGAFEAFLAAKHLATWRLREGIVGMPIGPALLHFPAPAKGAVA